MKKHTERHFVIKNLTLNVELMFLIIVYNHGLRFTVDVPGLAIKKSHV